MSMIVDTDRNAKKRNILKIAIPLLIAIAAAMLNVLYATGSPFLNKVWDNELIFILLCIEATLPIIQWLIRRKKAPTLRQTLCCFLLAAVLTVVLSAVHSDVLVWLVPSEGFFPFQIRDLPIALAETLSLSIIQTTVIMGAVCIWLWKKPILATCLPIVVSFVLSPVVCNSADMLRFAKDEYGREITRMGYETAMYTFLAIAVAVVALLVLVAILVQTRRTRKKTALTV